MAEAATVARPYAKAVFADARDAGKLADWSAALQAAAAIVADPRIVDLLSDPRLVVDRWVALFQGLGGAAIDARWQNFVRLLATNKRLHVLPQISAQYAELRARYENEVDVEVTSAVPLDAAQQAKLAAVLAKRFKHAVRLTTSIDPRLLGGAVIRTGDLVIDGSINGRLMRLASELST